MKKLRIPSILLCACFFISGITIDIPIVFVVSIGLLVIYQIEISENKISKDDFNIINNTLEQRNEEISKKYKEIQFKNKELKQKSETIKKNKEKIDSLNNELKQKLEIIEENTLEIHSLNYELEQKSELIAKNTLEIDSLISENKKNISEIGKQRDYIHYLTQEPDSTISKNAKETFILCAGKYEGGKDIPIGKYNLYISYGTGIVETNTPDYRFFRMAIEQKDIDEHNSTREYRNLSISTETILTITESAKITFYLQEDYTYSEEINEYELKYKKLKTTIDKQHNEIQKLSDIKQKIINSINTETENGVLSKGVYKIGEDIDVGKYDLKAVWGSGYISLSRGDIYFKMDSKNQDSYKNLNLTKGSKLEINGNIKILLLSSTKVEPSENTESKDILTTGTYKVGIDIQEGTYLFEAIKGYGSVCDNKDLDLYFNPSDKDEATKYRVSLKKGVTLEVDDDLVIKVYKSTIITGATTEHKETNMLYPGYYEVGIDIPFGYYTLSATYGTGSFSLKTYAKSRNDFYEDFSFDDDDDYYIKKYENILFGIGDKITIDGNLEIRLEFSRPYIYDYSSNIINDFNDLNKELAILNNTVIEKYYSFSNYDNITSQDCKNKLILLKQQEKEMRTKNKDIKTFDSFEKETRKEKLIRQALRCFNAECDNILMNVELKNIDSMRNKVQKSFDTINQLYSSNGLALSYDLLQLKLEQVTLIYTQMLKAIQEKEIQQEIKEQMRAEAKAEREIEEQKRKVEKDLKQHLSQVNRLMKFMQKTQLDAERQLYIEQIKELEEKIKVLEADKEKILKREANAKAGFVYVISNIGSFGEDIYKIGMTRRLEPMDRIKELSSASVPFEFDVHAMIFSSDAPELENMLHKHFSEYAVNKVNPRKEFFKISLDDIEKVVKENFDNTVQFTKIPLATEYRQSLEIS